MRGNYRLPVNDQIALVSGFRLFITEPLICDATLIVRTAERSANLDNDHRRQLHGIIQALDPEIRARLDPKSQEALEALEVLLTVLVE